MNLKFILPALAVLGSIISLCIGASIAKQLFVQIGAEGATTFRVDFAAAILLLVWRPWRMPLSKKEARAIGMYGVIVGLMNLVFYMSIRTIPLGIAIAIEFTGPLVLAVLSSRRPLDFVWIAFAVAGLLLLLPAGTAVQPLDPGGVLFAIASAVFWALYIVFAKRAGKAHAGQVTSLGLFTAACVVTPFGIAKSGASLLSPSLLLIGLAMGLLSSAIPYSLEMFALKRLPRPTFGILLSLEPAVGALAGYFILGQALSLLQWVAVSSVIVASVGTTLSIKTEEPVLDTADGAAPV